MRIEGTHTLEAPRQRVWEFVNDPMILAACTPGVSDMKRVGEDEYEAVMRIGVAGIRGTYRGKLAVIAREEPSRSAFQLEGSGTGAFVRVKAALDLEDLGERTQVRWSCDVQVGGVLASASRAIPAVTHMLAGQFMQALQQRLKEAAESAPTETAAAEGEGGTPVMTTLPRLFLNERVRQRMDADPSSAPRDFHRRMEGYRPSPLVSASAVAKRLGVERVWVKVESERFGLPAFKILGASWATYRALEEKFGPFSPWNTIEELKQQIGPALGQLTLAAATDGNHGRAVARMAALLGCRAEIFVPVGTAESRIEAIQGEGARVTVVDGTYDDAVARAASMRSDHCLVIADTDPEGSDPVPKWVIDGYSTIFWELEEQWAEQGARIPDLVVVQMGVGALASATVSHFRRPSAREVPALLGVEPVSAACILASMEAGTPVLVPGPHDSIMAGLNCGFPSLIAWPTVSAGIDVFAGASDAYVGEAVRLLAADGIEAGETGAAGLAGLLELQQRHDAEAERARERLRLGPTSHVLLICTEGITDPVMYQKLLSEKP